MKSLRNWLLGAGVGLWLAACSSSHTDEPFVATALAVPEPTVSVNHSTATVRWKTIENAQQYGWELLKEGESAPRSGSCFTSSYSFEMEDGALYNFRVRALPLAGTAWAASEWSEYVTASSNMLAAPRPELVAESLTDTSADLTWTAVEEASSYRFELYESGADKAVKSGSQSETRVSFTELTAGTGYRFRVQAVSTSADRNDSAWSEAVVFTTRKVEALNVPVVKVEATAAQSAELSWGKIEGAVEYAYELNEGSVEGAPVKSGRTDGLNVLFNDLKELTNYYFRIKAVPASDDRYAMESAFSDFTAFRTRSAASQDLDLGLPEHEQDGVIRAFPGAEGAGMYTTGGRGGKIIHVTNLNDSGPGSLRAAVSERVPRIIVFDVAGTIELKSTLKINTGNVSILGQTAPGDGICLKNYELGISADNVIIRYLRIRPGDMAGNDGMDALGARDMQNIIIDHCSMSWSTDECASFYVNKNMTMQWCLMYESLRNGKHNKGSHGYGGIWGGAPASFHHNVLAHHDSRNPRFDGPEQYGDQEQGRQNAKDKGIVSTNRLLDFRNNVVYNFCNYGGYGGVGITMNYIGNYYKWGPASVKGCGPSYKNGVESANKAVKRDKFFIADTFYNGNGLQTPVRGNPSLYLGDNKNNKFDTSVSDNASVGEAITADNKRGMSLNNNDTDKSIPHAWNWAGSPYAILADGTECYVTTHEADEAMNLAVKYAGASLRMDAADRRVLDDVLSGTGTSGEDGGLTIAGLKRSWYGIIDSQDDKGGYPDLKATEEELLSVVDTDGDGIPDHYEDLFGLDRNDASDGAAKTLDPQGLYTNFEIYAHYLVKDITLAQTRTGSYSK